MSGIGFFELVILFMIGLVVLGPKRLPQVANQLGTWVGQARRMARTMKRQLEEELDMKEDIDSLRKLRDDFRNDIAIDPGKPYVPRDDDSYSPVHGDAANPDNAKPDTGVDAEQSNGADEGTGEKLIEENKQ